MDSFFDIIQELNKVRISREGYYNLCDLYYRLHNIDVIEIVDDEYRLVPSYIFKGKRMELYEYELLISSNSGFDFEAYLLDITGRKCVSEIPRPIIELRKECFIKAIDECKRVYAGDILAYIDYVLNNNTIRNQVQSVFPNYSKENVFFTLY